MNTASQDSPAAQDSPTAWLQRRILEDATLTPQLFDDLREEERREGLVHDGRPICTTLQPFILSRARYTQVTTAAEILAQAFERLTAAALADESLMAELGLTKNEERLARIDPGYEPLCVSSRFDAFLSADDFKFLEYNAESPAGIADQQLLEQVFFKLPHMQEFLRRFAYWLPRAPQRLLEALLAAYRSAGGAEEHPQIAIVDWRGVATETEFFVLRDYFQAQGYPTAIADPGELSYDGRHLYATDFRIDIFYKRVIIHEFLDKFPDTEAHPLVRAYRDGRVVMANSFRTKMPHKKAGFAILSDERHHHLFSDEQRRAIRAHIPWTRHLRRGAVMFEERESELVELITEQQRRFVIKPNDDYGGAGVVLGGDVGEEEWQRKIAEAMDKFYIVQERAPVERIRVPVFGERVEMIEQLVDFDPFLFANKAEGGIVRLSSSSLSNVSAGGGVTALLVVEEK